MLPIGTVLYLDGGTKKMMIMNRAPIVRILGKRRYYDYSACVYPLGLDESKIFYFNEENIDRVIFEGLKDENEIHF